MFSVNQLKHCGTISTRTLHHRYGKYQPVPVTWGDTDTVPLPLTGDHERELESFLDGLPVDLVGQVGEAHVAGRVLLPQVRIGLRLGHFQKRTRC